MRFCCCFVIILLVITTVVVTTVVLVLAINEKESDPGNSTEGEELFELSIIHINDFHARFEETNERSLDCREGETCIGGVARMKTVIDMLRLKRTNSLLLDAGDNFKERFGTISFDTTSPLTFSTFSKPTSLR